MGEAPGLIRSRKAGAAAWLLGELRGLLARGRGAEGVLARLWARAGRSGALRHASVCDRWTAGTQARGSPHQRAPQVSSHQNKKTKA